MIRIVHVISDLDTGGAEITLFRLVAGMDRLRFENIVISLLDRGSLGDCIEAVGVPVHCLEMRRGRAEFSAVFKLVRLLRDIKPAVVQSWLYHSDLLSLVSTSLAGRPPMVWNVRCSDMDLQFYPRQTWWVLRALAWYSSRPAAVVVNSLAGKQLHEKIGYRPRRWEVIPNGFDLDRFRPNAVARNSIRHELGLSSNTVLVALIARLDPMKDHATFIDAATRVVKLRPNTHFLLAGKGVARLARQAVVEKLSNRVHLFGERQDIDQVLPGVDIACLSSVSEGFPNILGEAMAAEVPCVSTDVGDVRFLFSSTGRIVPVRDPEAMAIAIVELIDCGPQVRAELGRAARARIEAEFSLPRMIERYQVLYSDLCGLSH